MNKLTIALPKGKLFRPAAQIFGAELDERSRKLILEAGGLRFILAKPADVPVYVDSGVADLGVVGKDVLEESPLNVVELSDLKFGKCRLMMAVPATDTRRLEDFAHTRVATKFPRSARRFFAQRGMQMEFIKLNGSIELAPLIGLADSIVDIVETGTTLRENNLREVVTLFESTARLIANRVSYKLKFAEIDSVIPDIKKEPPEGGHGTF